MSSNPPDGGVSPTRYLRIAISDFSYRHLRIMLAMDVDPSAGGGFVFTVVDVQPK